MILAVNRYGDSILCRYDAISILFNITPVQCESLHAHTQYTKYIMQCTLSLPPLSKFLVRESGVSIPSPVM